MKSEISLIAALTALVFSAGCAGKPEEPPAAKFTAQTVVAEVGPRKITLSELDAELARYKSLLGVKAVEEGSDAKIREALLGRLMDNAVLDIEADAKSVTVPQDAFDARMKELLGEYDEARLGLALAESGITFEKWKDDLRRRMRIEALVEKEVDAAVEVTGEEIKKYYDENADSFVWPMRVRVLQIMVRDEAAAEQTRKKLAKDGDFAKIARESSQSPEAADGGDLGYVSEGQLPPELESVVFGLKVGEVSEVVKSIYGFHIFKVVDKEDPRPMSRSEADERIRSILLAPKREEAFKEWLANLKKNTPVKIHSGALSAPRS